MRRKLAERVLLSAVQTGLCSAENLQYILRRVEEEIRELNRDLPETIKLKQAEQDNEERRVQNFVEFVAEGRGSRALGEALAASEGRAEELRCELEALRRSQETVFQAPPLAWIEERVATFQEVLERRNERSALLLRKLLGTVNIVPIRGAIGPPYYRATSTLQTLALLEPPPGDPAADSGSISLRWWRRRESNPRPQLFGKPRRCTTYAGILLRGLCFRHPSESPGVHWRPLESSRVLEKWWRRREPYPWSRRLDLDLPSSGHPVRRGPQRALEIAACAHGQGL